MSNIPVNIRVQNNFSTTAATIQLWHQFSSNPPTSHAFSNVQGNGGSTGYTTINGSTGAGHDYWQIIVTLNNGTVWEHTSWKTCTIESSDANSHQTQVVSPGFWSIPLTSGGCTTSLSQAGSADVPLADREPEVKEAPAGCVEAQARA